MPNVETAARACDLLCELAYEDQLEGLEGVLTILPNRELDVVPHLHREDGVHVYQIRDLCAMVTITSSVCTRHW